MRSGQRQRRMRSPGNSRVCKILPFICWIPYLVMFLSNASCEFLENRLSEKQVQHVEKILAPCAVVVLSTLMGDKSAVLVFVKLLQDKLSAHGHRFPYGWNTSYRHPRTRCTRKPEVPARWRSRALPAFPHPAQRTAPFR